MTSGILVIAVFAWIGSAGAVAATPANDDVEVPQAIASAVPQAVTGSNVDATRQDDEFDHSGLGGIARGSVWFQWTPDHDGEVTFDACEADFAAIIGVYTGGPGITDLSPAAFSLGLCHVQFIADDANTYKIAVDTKLSDAGNQGAFTLKLRAAARPSNDNVEAAQPIASALPQAVTGSNVDATRQDDEVDHSGLGGSGGGRESVWFQWTPSNDDEVVLDACEADFEAVIGVYTGGPGITDLSPAAYSLGLCQVQFTADDANTYLIAVDTKLSDFGNQGAFKLKLSGTLPTPLSGTLPTPSVPAPSPATATGLRAAALKKCKKKKSKKARKKCKKRAKTLPA